MTPSLSETFDPPSTTTYGRSGLDGEPLEHVDLGLDQATRGRREPGGDVVDARVLAVHRAEPVGHEDVGERGQLVGERSALVVVLARLGGVEADVLEHGDLAVPQRGCDVLGLRADGVVGEQHR